jgi:hypothetical protein
VIGGAHLRKRVRESSRVSSGGIGGVHGANNAPRCLLTAYSAAPRVTGLDDFRAISPA